MHQYIAVGTERMFIEPSASTTIARLINSRVTAMIAAVATQLSALIQYSAIQYNAIQYNTMVARRGGVAMQCRGGL